LNDGAAKQQNGGAAMERFKSLNRYQKGIMLFMTVMILVFAVIYAVVISREGFSYQNTILIPNQENGNTVYSGRIEGEPASFTVYADRTVVFRYGDQTYGPYTAREDAAAIPKDTELGEFMTGVELRDGEEILFRGGVLSGGDYRWLYNEDGSLGDMDFAVTAGNGIIMDENGNAIDLMEPPASVILDLMAGPKLCHKGAWPAWFCGVLACAATVVLMLFADELFRWNLAFQIRNADQAEPSDWEIAGRYITWTLLPIAALILFITGLQ